ncbi:hypothetical protein YC2023_031010 [Brassica napus]
MANRRKFRGTVRKTREPCRRVKTVLSKWTTGYCAWDLRKERVRILILCAYIQKPAMGRWMSENSQALIRRAIGMVTARIKGDDDEGSILGRW